MRLTIAGLNDYFEELIFLVKENPEGGFFAKGLDVSIFTEAETMDELKEMIKDAVRCHFDDVVICFQIIKYLRSYTTRNNRPFGECEL